MTAVPHTAARATDIDGATEATGLIVPRLVEEASSTKTTVSLLFAGGLAVTGLLSGTGTTAPIAEPPVRYIGGWTSTARVVGPVVVGSGALRLPTGNSEAAASVRPGVEAAADVTPSAGTDRATQAGEVRWLHDASGLTWEQLGRIFGVSRRAVHLWANGGRMNATNAELLGRLVGVVRELPGDADERRAALLAPSADGTSIVDELRARNRSDARDISSTPFRPEELLGPRHDDPAPGRAQT